MTPYGSDRVRADGERVLLSSRLPKGWTPRVERTVTSAEFPGTAVLWENQYFEVLAAEVLPTGVRYTLAPWPEQHVMRVTDRYDAESEERRLAEHREAIGREKKRKSVGLLALLTGHLPAIVQERLGSEVGLLPARLTMISLISSCLAIAALLGLIATEMLRRNPIPIPPLLAAAYLFIETGIRFLVVWTQSRPAGSTLGIAAYILYWLLTGMRGDASPFARPAGHAVPISEPPDDVRLSDALAVREPLLTLLPVADQERLRARSGFDYGRLGTPVAAVLLTLAILGMMTAAINRQFIALLVAVAVAAEQMWRLKRLRRGPAASVLGWAIRPLLKELL